MQLKKLDAMANKSDIRFFAKELYLSADGEGKKLFSLRQISDKIRQKYKAKIHHSTVAEWAKSDGWDRLYTQAKQLGVQKAEERENELLDKKSSEISDLYKISRSLNLSAATLLVKMLEATSKGEQKDPKEAENIKNLFTSLSGRDLIQLFKITADFLMEMNSDAPKENTTPSLYDYIKAKYYPQG
jgi:hypothetical protein